MRLPIGNLGQQNAGPSGPGLTAGTHDIVLLSNVTNNRSISSYYREYDPASAVYATAAGGGGTVSLGSSFLFNGQVYSYDGDEDDHAYTCYESFITFDTLAQNGLTCTSATLHHYCQFSSHASAATYELRSSSFGTPDTSDFVTPAGMTGTTLATIASSSLVSATNVQWSSVGSNLANAINLSGNTQLYIVSDQHRQQIAPGTPSTVNHLQYWYFNAYSSLNFLRITLA